MLKKLLVAMTFAFVITTAYADNGKSATGECVELCNVDGIKKLVASNGYQARLFAEQHTSPTLVIEYNGQRCYGDLIAGNGRGINLDVAGAIYHTHAPDDCVSCDSTFCFIPGTSDVTYSFQISASGDFIIDWGDGEIQPIKKTDTDLAIYTHEYKDGKPANGHTIGLNGAATGYSTELYVASVSFPSTIKMMSGCLGCIFGTINDGGNGKQPRFYRTFMDSTQLTEIPPRLFNGVHGAPIQLMFADTFAGCSGLKAIPAGLFAGIKGAPASSMFSYTFYGCSGLESIGDGLFGDIEGNAQSVMFYNTFAGCTSLTGPSATVGTGANKQYLYQRWPNTSYAENCYTGATGLDDRACIPTVWGGAGTRGVNECTVPISSGE